MDNSTLVSADRLVELAGRLTMAYVAHNSVQAAALPVLIQTVHGALASLGQPVVEPGPARATPEQIRRSISHAHLISFENGRPYRYLRQHLAERGLTPQAYRAKWGLPADYPMTPPNCSEQRSEFARVRRISRPSLGPVAAKAA